MDDVTQTTTPASQRSSSVEAKISASTETCINNVEPLHNVFETSTITASSAFSGSPISSSSFPSSSSISASSSSSSATLTGTNPYNVLAPLPENTPTTVQSTSSQLASSMRSTSFGSENCGSNSTFNGEEWAKSEEKAKKTVATSATPALVDPSQSSEEASRIPTSKV